MALVAVVEPGSCVVTPCFVQLEQAVAVVEVLTTTPKMAPVEVLEVGPQEDLELREQVVEVLEVLEAPLLPVVLLVQVPMEEMVKLVR
jgi:hypothetical protein